MSESETSLGHSFSAATRHVNLERLGREEFDLLIVGGGITGVATARDASLRGFRTALVDKGDFGCGTSSRSTRLIHGGIRYLEYGEFKLVFNACSERRVMRRIAPRLVRPLPFLYPIYRGQQPSSFKIRAGMVLYDALSLFRNVQNHRWLRPAEVQRREPLVAGRGLLSAGRYYDAQVNDARLTLITAKAAHLRGAVMVNHAPVVGLMKAGGRVVGACVRDALSGRAIEVRAKIVVNATGIWTDEILALDDRSQDSMIRPTKGVHLLIPRARLYSQHAIIFSVPRDGRHVFLIPWGDFTLIGTTDTDCRGGFDSPAAISEDVGYLLEAICHAFPGAQVGADDVVSTFAGLRPLVSAPGSPSALSRHHVIIESPSGLITVAGGKLTTHRLMAEQVTDRVEKRLAEDFGVHARFECRTKQPLSGAQMAHIRVKSVSSSYDASSWNSSGSSTNSSGSSTNSSGSSTSSSEHRASSADGSVAEHLMDAYGDDVTWVLAYAEENPSLGERIVPGAPYLMAEALYAVQHEMALTLCDVLVRRTHVIYETQGGGVPNARAVAELMAPRLGWDETQVERQVAEYAAQVALTHRWRDE